jgi:cytochrome c oxidase subunit 1
MAETADGRGFFASSGGLWLREWFFTTDHKRIGMLYLWSILIFFVVGVFLGLAIRLELFTPGRTIMGQQAYNAIFTLHGVIMIFLVVIPSIPAAFGNIFLPLQLGAEDVAFPRLNMFSWWLYAIGGATALVSLFTGGGPPPPTSRWPCSGYSSSGSRPSSPGSTSSSPSTACARPAWAGCG